MRLETILFCRLEEKPFAEREQIRLAALAQSGLLNPMVPTIFQEATHIATELLAMPIGWISILEQHQFRLKVAIGLDKLGILNDLRTSRCLDRTEAFGIHVVDSVQVLAIADTKSHPAFSLNSLTQQYGIRSYLGAPLLTRSGQCLGTLAVLDTQPREFTHQNLQILAMLARWCLSEYERDLLSAQVSPSTSTRPSQAAALPESTVTTQAAATSSGSARTAPLVALNPPSSSAVTEANLQQIYARLRPLCLRLIHRLTEELNNPLAVILGMVSMLEREVYGPLTPKQRIYLERMHGSGQELASLIQDVLQLSLDFEETDTLNLIPVDVELLCHQVTHSLDSVATNHNTDIKILLEPGQQLWCLDRDLVRQALYHLLYSLLQTNKERKTLKIQVSYRRDLLCLTCWLSYTSGTEGVRLGNAYTQPTWPDTHPVWSTSLTPLTAESQPLPGSGLPLETALSTTAIATLTEDQVFADLRIQLSRALVALHGGTLHSQAVSDVSYVQSQKRAHRYQLIIPIRKAR